MSLQVTTRFPGGNAAGIDIRNQDQFPEVRFSSDPCGGAEALWFYFRIEESAPDPAKHSKIRITWTQIENVYGGDATAWCLPVISTPGHTWQRLKQGEECRNEAGLREVSWWIPHPAPSTEVAFCFPYGTGDVAGLLEKSREFWHSATIGITQGGRNMNRLYNTMGTTGGTQPAIFLIARQHAGETPGSWVLDGMLRHWALNRKGGYMIWAVPFGDPDGVEWGWYGRENSPHDLDRSWSDPPLRHEALVVRNDLLRWKARGKPLLVIDFHAPPAFEKDGVYAYAATDGATAAEETKWCNVIRNELQADYAATDFRRADLRPSRGNAPTLVSFVRQQWGIPALSLQVPYAQSGSLVLSQKNYREMGQRITQAIMRRNG